MNMPIPAVTVPLFDDGQGRCPFSAGFIPSSFRRDRIVRLDAEK